jgi:hypothetical protein
MPYYPPNGDGLLGLLIGPTQRCCAAVGLWPQLNGVQLPRIEDSSRTQAPLGSSSCRLTATGGRRYYEDSANCITSRFQHDQIHVVHAYSRILTEYA